MRRRRATSRPSCSRRTIKRARIRIAGFKRDFKGEILEEVYTPLGQLDFSAELAKVAAAKPEVFFTFMPGGMGVNLVKQWMQAGLDDSLPLRVHRRRVDPARREGRRRSASSAAPTGRRTWTIRRARLSSAAYEAAYGSGARHLRDAGLRRRALDRQRDQGGGRQSLRPRRIARRTGEGDFTSLRGKFKFGVNHYPIQDFYLVKVAKRPDGKYQTEIVEKRVRRLR